MRPKPMVEIGGYPILWHIMKMYSHYGLEDFIICLGYKGHMIKEYFANYMLRSSDVQIDLSNDTIGYLNSSVEPWRITLVNTGSRTMTGGRLKRIRELIGDETFCMTYGDGVTNIDLRDEIEFHRRHGALATVAAVQPPGRFGAFLLGEDESKIEQFKEKPLGDGAWVNGGFFVLEPQVFDYIDGDMVTFEEEPMQRLSQEGQLHAYKHPGFWQSMDSLRDKMYLEKLWAEGNPEWRVWTSCD